MHEIDERLAAYYNELEPSKRLNILEDLRENLQPEVYEFAREIYSQRHTDPKHPNKPNIDWWLWRCVCLTMIFPRRRIFKKFTSRELNAILREVHVEDCDSYNDSQKALLFHEYRNLARRYLSTCRADGYASAFLGLKKATPEEKVYKACEEIYFMSSGIAKAAGFEAKMSLWCEAFRDELMDYDPLCREFFERISVKY